jgi:hypothetical protein
LVRAGVRANLLAGVTPSEAAIVDAATAGSTDFQNRAPIGILNGHELSGFWPTHARLKDEYEKGIAPR